MLRSNSTRREIENVTKNYLFSSTKIAYINEIVELSVPEQKLSFYFQIIYIGAPTYAGYTYVLKPTFNTNFKL